MAARTPVYCEDTSLSLTMAAISASPAPLIMLDAAFLTIAASTSFCEAFELVPETVLGVSVLDLGEGEWNVPQLRSLLTATGRSAPIEPYEMDLERPGREVRHLILQAKRLVYMDVARPSLLMAVADVTAARAREETRDAALARNVVLLQEVRHRVANSLQIIASVLLQNARRSRSRETRGHLQDAHQRVMSVAALERLLSTSVTGPEHVDIHAYLTRLCESIAASMISASDHISLKVDGGHGAVSGQISISLGLIVTELVINALKHAFRPGRGGAITVEFEIRGPNWRLRVCDDGVGMPSDPALICTGLGTNIVQALAQQLRASVDVQPCSPGTAVCIQHTQIALVADDRNLVGSVASVAGKLG